MGKADRYFIASGIVAALIGMSLGIVMGIRGDFSLAPAHAHANLVGWATLCLFGLAYRSGLARNDRWAMIHFAIALSGAIALPLGIAVSILEGRIGLAVIGSFLTLGSMILFSVNFWRARAG